jgi:hypothetical protein
LCAVFAFGLTPVQTLHDVVAKHKDQPCQASHGKTHQVTKAGFNCKCIDLVAESNFLPGIALTIDAAREEIFSYTAHIISFPSLTRPLFNLRGPPLTV